ncbi:LysR family transcriptional regulator [Diaphorobacter sp.]|uniref:LysR family transcriptional regulator n=1 Tax=Diaphorobacter sp. TaxID=1934310 RepID=UPI0028AA137F|nr:LysR family transcriptional regulator [Diaphorobacter sp.]
MSTDIELRRLQHFVLLAEECNFTRAADRANLSQTAFSRSIQALEDRLAIRVFDRGTRSVRLTAAGQQLLGKARQLLLQARDLAREMEDVANADGGELSFGASLMAVDWGIKRLLPVLMRQSPRLTVNVEVSHWRLLQQHLEQERIEFFASYPGSLAHDSDFSITPLPPVATSIFCRQGHPLVAAGIQPRPQDLPRFRWATVQFRDDAKERMSTLFGVPAGAPLPLALSSDNLSLLREAILTSDMLLFTWSSWLQDDLATGQMVDLGQLLRPVLPQRERQIDFAIVQLQGRTASPAARRMIELITESTAQTSSQT